MLEAYRQHVAERGSLGIPPLPLTAPCQAMPAPRTESTRSTGSVTGCVFSLALRNMRPPSASIPGAVERVNFDFGSPADFRSRVGCLPPPGARRPVPSRPGDSNWRKVEKWSGLWKGA